MLRSLIISKENSEKRSELTALQAQVNDLEKREKEAKESLMHQIEAEPGSPDSLR
jgi:hypothetical protein